MMFKDRCFITKTRKGNAESKKDVKISKLIRELIDFDATKIIRMMILIWMEIKLNKINDDSDNRVKGRITARFAEILEPFENWFNQDLQKKNTKLNQEKAVINEEYDEQMKLFIMI